MVAKARTISYGTAKLEYDANKTIDHIHVASEVCRHNLYGDTPGEITREMHDVQENHHRNLSKCYFDIVVTLSEQDADEVKSPEQCRELVEEYMNRLMTRELGLSQEQFRQIQWIAYQHERTDHNRNLRHWHVLANRVLQDGTVVSDSFIGKKAAKVANDISRERGFSVAEEISPKNKEEIREAAFRILGGMDTFSFDIFKMLMAVEGFEVREAYAKSGKLQGYYILSKSGTQYKASAIDRSLTLGRIENTWKILHKGQVQKKAVAHRPSENPTRIGTHTLSSILNAHISPAHSRNREDEVGSKRSHYDDELEERSKGYSM
jgi:hypothetical protein